MFLFARVYSGGASFRAASRTGRSEGWTKIAFEFESVS
jgi:hypothetical protein